MQKVPIKRFRNCLNDKFWLGTLFTVNLFLQLLAIIRSLQASIVYLASCLIAVKMVALQESRKRKETLVIIREKKKAANNVSVLGAFSPSFPLISCRFLSVRLVTTLPQAKAPYCLFLLSIFLLWTPAILTLYVNTTLVVPVFS